MTLFGGVACLLLRRTCAFSLVKVKVLFFPLYRRRAICTATHKSKALISLYSFSSNSLSFLVVKVAFEKKGRFFSNAHSRDFYDIFLLFLTPTPTQRRDIYIHNNAAFPRAIPQNAQHYSYNRKRLKATRERATRERVREKAPREREREIGNSFPQPSFLLLLI